MYTTLLRWTCSRNENAFIVFIDRDRIILMSSWSFSHLFPNSTNSPRTWIFSNNSPKNILFVLLMYLKWNYQNKFTEFVLIVGFTYLSFLMYVFHFWFVCYDKLFYFAMEIKLTKFIIVAQFSIDLFWSSWPNMVQKTN